MPIISTAAGLGAAAAAGGVSTAPAWISAITTGLAAVGSWLSGIFTNQKNESLQRESWNRQSVGYRVKELQSVGLNKLLAANANPSYGLSTSMKTPEFPDIGNAVGKGLDAYTASLERENIKKETELKSRQLNILNTEAQIKEKNLEVLKHDVSVHTGRSLIASDDPALLKMIMAGMDFMGLPDETQGSFWDIMSYLFSGGRFKTESDRLRNKVDSLEKELREEKMLKDSNYQSLAEYDDALTDIPGVEYDAYNNPVVYDRDGHPLVYDRKKHRWYRP